MNEWMNEWMRTKPCAWMIPTYYDKKKGRGGFSFFIADDDDDDDDDESDAENPKRDFVLLSFTICRCPNHWSTNDALLTQWRISRRFTINRSEFNFSLSLLFLLGILLEENQIESTSGGQEVPVNRRANHSGNRWRSLRCRSIDHG